MCFATYVGFGPPRPVRALFNLLIAGYTPVFLHLPVMMLCLHNSESTISWSCQSRRRNFCTHKYPGWISPICIETHPVDHVTSGLSNEFLDFFCLHMFEWWPNLLLYIPVVLHLQVMWCYVLIYSSASTKNFDPVSLVEEIFALINIQVEFHQYASKHIPWIMLLLG